MDIYRLRTLETACPQAVPIYEMGACALGVRSVRIRGHVCQNISRSILFLAYF